MLTIIVVIVILLNFMIDHFRLPKVLFLFGLYIVVICGMMLYKGSRLARWVIGSLLLLFGCMFTYLEFTRLDYGPVLVVSLFFPTFTLMPGLFLMFSKDVSLFLDEKRTSGKGQQ